MVENTRELEETLLSKNPEQAKDPSSISDTDLIDLPRGGVFNLKPSTCVLLPSLILGSLVLLGLVPILPQLQLTWFPHCSSNVTADDDKHMSSDQVVCVPDYENAQFWSGLLQSAQNLLGFFMAPQIGRLTDLHGRKPFLLVTTLMTFLPLLSLRLTNAASPTAYYSVTIISGLFGVSRFGGAAISNAYISDCTTKKERTVALSLVGATFGLSMLGAPIYSYIANQLADPMDFLSIMVVLASVNLFYLLLVVPESHYPDNSRKPRVDQNTEQKVMKKQFELINPLEPLKLLWNSEVLFWTGLIAFLGGFAESGVAQLGLLYLNEVYGLSPKEAVTFDGYVFGVFGASAIIAQVFVIRLFLRLKMSHSTMISVCLFFNGFHIYWYAMLRFFPMWTFFLNCIPMGLTVLFFVTVFSFVSQIVDKSEYGFALGTLGSIQGLCGILGPLTFSQIYSVMGKTGFRELPFVIGGSLAMAGMFVSIFKLRDVEVRHLASKLSSTKTETSNRGQL